MIFSWEYVDKTARKRDNSQYQFVLFSLKSLSHVNYEHNNALENRDLQI